MAVILTVVAAFIFIPDDSRDLDYQQDETKQGEQAHDLAEFSESNPEHQAVTDGEEGSAEQRAEVEELSEIRGETTKKEAPYAKLVVRLYGENDSILNDAIAGILQLPEPNSNFSGLQPLFFTMQGRPPKSFVLNEVKVDDEGVAVLPLPKNKPGWVVYGRAFGRLVGFKIINHVASGETHDAGILVLRRGGSLRVEVTDDGGNAIADAGVLLVSEDKSDPTEMPIHYLRTNADGIADFNSLNFASYEMDVARVGYLSVDKRRVAITERGDGLEKVVLQTGGKIGGKVVDLQGRPVPDIPISIRAENHRHRPQGLTEDLLQDQVWATSGVDGAFEGTGLRPDATYTLAAAMSNEVAVRSTGHRVDDHVVLKVNRTVKFRGRILRADGTPAVGAVIGMQSTAESSHIIPLSLTTAADGSFEGNLLRGVYRLCVHHESGEYIHEKVIRVKSAMVLPDVTLPNGGGLELTFYQPDGQPLKQVYLTEIALLDYAKSNAETKDLLQWLKQLRRKDISVHENVCRIDGLAPGPVKLKFHSPGFLPPTLTIDVIEGKLHRQEITLDEGGSVSLTISGPEGFDPQRLVYRLVYQDPVPDRHQDLRLNFRFLVDENGQVQRKDLLPGTWAVVVSDDSNPGLGGTPGAELGRFSILPGTQSKTFEIR